MDKKIDKAAEAKQKEAEKKEAEKKLPDETLDKVSGGRGYQGDNGEFVRG